MSYSFDGKARPKGRNLVPWALLLLSHPFERDHLAPAFLRRVGRFRSRRCRGGFHEAADLFCRTSLHIVGDVRIGVQSEARAVVTQHAIKEPWYSPEPLKPYVDRIVTLDCENDNPKEYQRIMAAYKEDQIHQEQRNRFY